MECVVIAAAVAAFLQSIEIIGRTLQALYDWSKEKEDGINTADHLQLHEHQKKLLELLKAQQKLQQDCSQLPAEDQSYLQWLNVTISKDLEFLHYCKLKKQRKGQSGPWSCFHTVYPDMDVLMTKVEECLKRSRMYVDHVTAARGQNNILRSDVGQLQYEQSEHRDILSSIARGNLLTPKQLKKLCPYFNTKRALILEPGFKEEEGKVYLIEEVSMGRATERGSRRVRLCTLTFWLREVSNPYVAQIARVIETELCFYLYSEVGDCRPLRDWLNSKAGGSEVEQLAYCKELARSLCEGVRYMHHNRMVHKNINSKNVVVKGDVSACVLTGLIETRWMLQDSDNVENEDPQAARWRMLYQSPERREVIAAGTACSTSKAVVYYAPACDIYSLGMVMAEIALRVSFFDLQPSLQSKEQVDQFVQTRSHEEFIYADADLLIEWYWKCTHPIGAMRPSVHDILETLVP